MLTAFMGPIPVPYTTPTGTGDFWVGVVAILVVAVALTVALVLASTPRKATHADTRMRGVKQAPTTNFSKAA
ncbi:MAG TPA: hypothetical protein VMW11_09060 [Candidatus Dormibacteraeota bacterium]|nr:hypothetical protein [Candidatus Dormibacteraeota bacterium]